MDVWANPVAAKACAAPCTIAARRSTLGSSLVRDVVRFGISVFTGIPRSIYSAVYRVDSWEGPDGDVAGGVHRTGNPRRRGDHRAAPGGRRPLPRRLRRHWAVRVA